jgi:hypothetical protein
LPLFASICINLQRRITLGASARRPTAKSSEVQAPRGFRRRRHGTVLTINVEPCFIRADLRP